MTHLFFDEIVKSVEEVVKGYNAEGKEIRYISNLVRFGSIEGFKEVWSAIEDNQYKLKQAIDVYRAKLWLAKEIDNNLYHNTDNWLYRGNWHITHPFLHGFSIVTQDGEQVTSIEYDGRKKTLTYHCYGEPFKLYGSLAETEKSLEIMNLYNNLCDSGITLSIIPLTERLEYIGKNHDWKPFAYKFDVKADLKPNIRGIITSIKEQVKKIDIDRLNLIQARTPSSIKTWKPMLDNKKAGETFAYVR
jgi:hypothetical protein